MKSLRLRYKLTIVVGIAVTIGLVATSAFYTRHQEASVLAQNERTMHKLTESVIQGLQSVMLAGSADIAQSFADRLKRVEEIADFRIMRVDGNEAFRDNRTITAVNERRGEQVFAPREAEATIPVVPATDPDLRRAIETRKPVSVYTTDDKGQRHLTFFAPIDNQQACYKCHGKAEAVRGVLKLTTSLAPVERDILKVRQDSLLILVVALAATMLLTGYMMGRTVIKPIEAVTQAMARVSSGDLDHRVPTGGKDELARMASSFNLMTSELKTTYEGLRREQDKLTTIIFGAGEGIIVTGNDGEIVLVNPAAERLLGKPLDRIVGEGFENLFDKPEEMRRWLASENGDGPQLVAHGDRFMHVYASTIRGDDGRVVGSAALLRDITEEKRLEAELRRLSTTDGLTGLFNRRHLDETLDKEFHRAVRTSEPLAVIMFDVDHFKKFNDTHGHDQGDRVLQAVAQCLRDALRKYDLPCRYGGEEFVGILPKTTADGAHSVAERLRKDIEAMVVDGLKVTISLGVASFPELNVETPESLIESADAALYKAKAGGRNRTVVAGRESAQEA